MSLPPGLPTNVGTSHGDLSGILLPIDDHATLSSLGCCIMRFRPFRINGMTKTYLCDESSCTIQLTTGRAVALGLSENDEISLVHATIETHNVDQKISWKVVVEDFPVTLIGAHARKSDISKSVDLFAGLANWSVVAQQMGLNPRVSIEIDPRFAAIGARNIHVPMWNANECTDHWNSDFGRAYMNQAIMIAADIRNEQVREPISRERCGLLTGSPPCPPWSGLSANRGLSDSRGRLFLVVADVAAFLGSQIIVLENVANILSHADWPEMVQYYEQKGYVNICQTVDALQGYLPVVRTRACIVFVRHDFHWVSIPSSLGLPFKSDHLAADSFGAIHSHECMTHPLLKELTSINDDDMILLTNPKFFTAKVAEKVSHGMSAIEARARGGHRPLPCPTARYAKPSSLSHETLGKHKLTMVVAKQENEFRWYSPFEFAAGLGMSPLTMLPVERELAYMMVGNTIAPLHVAINLCRVFACTPDFRHLQCSISQLIQRFATNTNPLSNCDIANDDEVMWLEPRKQQTLIPRSLIHAFDQCVANLIQKSQDAIQHGDDDPISQFSDCWNRGVKRTHADDLSQKEDDKPLQKVARYDEQLKSQGGHVQILTCTFEGHHGFSLCYAHCTMQVFVETRDFDHFVLFIDRKVFDKERLIQKRTWVLEQLLGQQASMSEQVTFDNGIVCQKNGDAIISVWECNAQGILSRHQPKPYVPLKEFCDINDDCGIYVFPVGKAKDAPFHSRCESRVKTVHMLWNMPLRIPNEARPFPSLIKVKCRLVFRGFGQWQFNIKWIP